MHGTHNPRWVQQEGQLKVEELCVNFATHDAGKAELTSLVASLRACAKSKDLFKGTRVYAELLRRGFLGQCTYIAEAVLSMYTKCGELGRAKELFNGLTARDVFCWTALIAGYAQQGRGWDALNYYEFMQHDGFYGDAVTFACILKACGGIGAVDKGKQIHDEIVKQGLLGKDIVLGNALVDMYVKCGALEKARRVLEDLPVRDAISWNALIVGHTKQGQAEEALHCFEHMQNEGLSPNAVTFACMMKACGSIGRLETGEKIHDNIIREGLLEEDVVLGNALVYMYAKCGALAKALRVLMELPCQDVVSWSTLIVGYAQKGESLNALNCVREMQRKGFFPDGVTYACILKACGDIGEVEKGKEIHDEIDSHGLLGRDTMLGNSLVGMYVKCGALYKAQQALEELPLRDAISWNVLIAGYVQQGLNQDALDCFERMQYEGISPEPVTFACTLKACGSTRAVEKGEKIHDQIAKQGLVGRNILLSNALIDMYAKCEALEKAKQVMEELPVRDVFSWAPIIAGYVEQGRWEEALNCYERMRGEGFFPTEVALTYILKACGSMGTSDKGEWIHDELAQQGLVQDSVIVGTAVVDMYAKCGALTKARQVLDGLSLRDMLSWTALITGYAHQGYGEEALQCLEQMQQEGFFPSEITLASILRACGEIGAANRGKEIHNMIANQGLFRENLVLRNGLVDMYAKCGSLREAARVLEELPTQDVVSWNALIAGYAQQGHSEHALVCFERMQGKGLSPDAFTFSCVFNALSHSGLVDAGQMHFVSMCTAYGINPELEHYICLVDLLGRAGLLAKAVAMVDKMPSQDYCVIWFALLGACRKWEHVAIGKWAFTHAVQLDESEAVPYLLMGNIYAAAGMHEDEQRIEAMRWKNQALKKPRTNQSRVVHVGWQFPCPHNPA